MPEPECATTRRAFRWPGEAREIVRAYLSEAKAAGEGIQTDLKSLIAETSSGFWKSQGRMLEVRTPSRYCVKTGVPALDKKRAAETPRLDCDPPGA